jgi:hypothetical protein
LIPNTGAERGLPQAEHRALADVAQPLGQPTDVVVFPSPAFVGVIPETQMSLASGLSESRSIASSEIFAL